MKKHIYLMLFGLTPFLSSADPKGISDFLEFIKTNPTQNIVGSLIQVKPTYVTSDAHLVFDSVQETFFIEYTGNVSGKETKFNLEASVEAPKAAKVAKGTNALKVKKAKAAEKKSNFFSLLLHDHTAEVWAKVLDINSSIKKNQRNFTIEFKKGSPIQKATLLFIGDTMDVADITLSDNSEYRFVKIDDSSLESEE